MRERASSDAQHLLNKIGGKYSGQPVARRVHIILVMLQEGIMNRQALKATGRKKIVREEAQGSPIHNADR